MANETIYGCVEWATGKVKFTQDNCIYRGCIVRGGVHDGQVAVTINTPNCNDTYYGCVNWGTGKFEVSVPDNCCATTDCEWCEGAPPGWIDVTFTGLSDYGCDCYYDVYGYHSYKSVGIDMYNGTWRVPYYGECAYHRFSWDPDPLPVCSECQEWWTNQDCSGIYGFKQHINPSLSVYLIESGVYIQMHSSNIGVAIFQGTINYTGDDSCGDTENSCNNTYTLPGECWQYPPDPYVRTFCTTGSATVSIA
ncbi:MAG TPA: hypothetical protein VMW16_03670 [Sedimentisphaerales bacterium]|nr:hypothetical protein [Sedimentisphaerales bacterium]